MSRILKSGNINQIGIFTKFNLDMALSEKEIKNIIKKIESKLPSNEKLESADYQLLVEGFIKIVAKENTLESKTK